MKTYLFSLLILCSILSCSKSSDATPAVTVSYISMKINGVEWKSSTGLGGISSGNFSATGSLDVTGGKDVLVFAMVNCASVGTVYKLEETNDRLFQFTRSASKISYFIGKDTKGSSGTLTITKTKAGTGVLTYANATFSGTANGTDGSKITITEGKIVNSQVQ
jgi:hypothetical protein